MVRYAVNGGKAFSSVPVADGDVVISRQLMGACAVFCLGGALVPKIQALLQLGVMHECHLGRRGYEWIASRCWSCEIQGRLDAMDETRLTKLPGVRDMRRSVTRPEAVRDPG